MKKIIILVSLFIIIIQINIITFCYEIDNEVIDVNAEIETYSKAEIDKTKTPNINSRSAIVIDRNSNYILYGKNENNKVKMASTTKIMTAIVVLETYPLDKTVEVSKKAANTGGSRLGLKTGDKISIRDLLYGLMLCSGNDAAVCLAENVAGGIPEFSELMNNKAIELGLVNTNFESPHGLDSNNHYTTAYELALLSNYALNNSTFLNIVGTKKYTVTINGYPKAISNTNELLGSLNGVYGIKTGFTNGANRCLVSACKRDEMDIICVVLGADTKNYRTKDSIKLIEYSFKNFEYFNIKDFVTTYLANWQNNNPDFFIIEKGNSNNLDIQTNHSIDDCPVIPIKKELIPNIEATITINNYLQAPIEKGFLLGSLKISSHGIDIVHYDLISNTDINKKNILDYFYNFLITYPNHLNIKIF